MRYGSAHQLSPIARQQAQLYGGHVRGLGLLGLTGSESGAVKGASAGASIGSVVPILGTAVGAILGAVGGTIAGALGKRDPEQYNFDQLTAIWRQNPAAVINIGNKYLPLAGLFDLNIKTNIPIYRRYGHMGEQKFLTDMATTIYNAAQNGTITASDTPQTIMTRVVQPWIDSWGFGPMSDPNQGAIQMLLLGLIVDYVTGQQTNWRAIGGQYPFGSLPVFKLPTTPVISSSSTPTSTSGTAKMPISPNGTTITPTSGGTITTPFGTFTFRPSDKAWLMNGNPVGYYPADETSLMWDANNNRVIGMYSNGGAVKWGQGDGAWINFAPAGTYDASGNLIGVSGSAPAGAGASFPTFPGFQQGLPASDPRLAVPWQETENGYTTSLTPVPGGPGLFSGQYPDGTSQFQFTISGTSVQGLRKSAVGWGTYTGTIASDGRSVSGNVLWYDATHPNGWQFPFAAIIQTEQIQPVPSGTASPATPQASTVATSTPAAVTTSTTTVPIPAGYSIAATDQATGLPVYVGANGYYYSWNGTTMTPYSGTTTNGYVISGGLISQQAPPSLTSGSQQLYNTANPAQDYSSVPASAPSNAVAPATTPVTAGVTGAGLPSWLTWGAVAGAAYLMFATARPSLGGAHHYKSRRYSKGRRSKKDT